MKKAIFQDMVFGKHAAPISLAISDAIEKGSINLNTEDDLDKFIEQLQNAQKDKLGRATSINLLNINTFRKI